MADEQEEREADWKAGSHTDADGKRWKLDSMSYEHLERTIISSSIVLTLAHCGKLFVGSNANSFRS